MVILVTGGSRSGKSRFAQALAQQKPGPHAYLATAQAFDGEMKARIEAHRRTRPAQWKLLEEPVRVPESIAQALGAARTVLLDCVTLWMSNLLLTDESFDESRAEASAEKLVTAARATPGATVIIVTNEVGSGVVPQTALGRKFRDCAGRANEVIARGADEVYLLVSGIPVRIKPGADEGRHESRHEGGKEPFNG